MRLLGFETTPGAAPGGLRRRLAALCGCLALVFAVAPVDTAQAQVAEEERAAADARLATELLSPQALEGRLGGLSPAVRYMIEFFVLLTQRAEIEAELQQRFDASRDRQERGAMLDEQDALTRETAELLMDLAARSTAFDMEALTRPLRHREVGGGTHAFLLGYSLTEEERAELEAILPGLYLRFDTEEAYQKAFWAEENFFRALNQLDLEKRRARAAIRDSLTASQIVLLEDVAATYCDPDEFGDCGSFTNFDGFDGHFERAFAACLDAPDCQVTDAEAVAAAQAYLDEFKLDHDEDMRVFFAENWRDSDRERRDGPFDLEALLLRTVDQVRYAHAAAADSLDEIQSDAENEMNQAIEEALDEGEDAIDDSDYFDEEW